MQGHAAEGGLPAVDDTDADGKGHTLVRAELDTGPLAEPSRGLIESTVDKATADDDLNRGGACASDAVAVEAPERGLDGGGGEDKARKDAESRALVSGHPVILTSQVAEQSNILDGGSNSGRKDSAPAADADTNGVLQ